MSSVMSEVKCQRCGFPYAKKRFYGRTMKWDVGCPRCGYFERWEHVSLYSSGHVKHGIIQVLYSAGAYFAKWADGSDGVLDGLFDTAIEEKAAEMRADIASGKLSPESYVTRYNFDTHEVTAVVGRVPTSHPLEPESVFKEQTSEAVDEQEDDDPSSEI